MRMVNPIGPEKGLEKLTDRTTSPVKYTRPATG